MRVAVDRAVCCSYGMCAETVPRVFSFADDGTLTIANLIPVELEARVRFACEQCPTQALSIEEE